MVLFALFGFVVPEIFGIQNQGKSLKMMSRLKFFLILNLHISVTTTHPNISNHTFFEISFSSLSTCAIYSFSISRNCNNWYFSAHKGLTGKFNFFCVLGNSFRSIFAYVCIMLCYIIIT